MKYLLQGALIGASLDGFLVCVAIADPKGWAAWRIALACSGLIPACAVADWTFPR